MACYCFPKDPNNLAISVKTNLCQQARLHYFADKMLKLINVNQQIFFLRKYTRHAKMMYKIFINADN